MSVSKRTIATFVCLGMHAGLTSARQPFMEPAFTKDDYVKVAYVGQTEGPDALSEPITVEVWSRGIVYPHDVFGKKPSYTFELSAGKEQTLRIFSRNVYMLLGSQETTGVSNSKKGSLIL